MQGNKTIAAANSESDAPARQPATRSNFETTGNKIAADLVKYPALPNRMAKALQYCWVMQRQGPIGVI
jgi:hypothetical protein